jgi:type II secretory pathway pseudopilin PulG
MANRRKRDGRGGFTLVELLIYSALLGTVMTAGMGVFVGANRMFALTNLAQERLVHAREIRHDYLAHVRQATAVVPRYRDFELGSRVVPLALTPDAEGNPRFGVYTVQLHRGRILYFEFTEYPDRAVTDKASTHEGSFDNIRFDVTYPPGAASPLVSVSMQIRPEAGEPKGDRPVHRYTASPRGTLAGSGLEEVPHEGE